MRTVHGKKSIERSGLVAASAAAAAALLLGGVATPARAEEREPTKQELLDQLKALQARVEQMEAKQKQTENAVDTATVDRTVHEVLQDAQQRSQLLAPEGFTAGYDNGKFLIQSSDGKFTMNPNIQAQFRYVADFRQDSKNGSPTTDDTQSGFELRRLKLVFEGNVFGKENYYKFQWATSRSNGNLVLEEAYIRHQICDGPFSVRAGTFVNGFDHETGTSSKRQLAVERSYLHETITGGGAGGENYIQGITGIYESQVLGNALRAELTYHDGFNSRNTNFTDTGGGAPIIGLNNPQWGVAGRVEYKLAGDWKQYEDFTALNNKTDLLVIGAGGDYESADGVNAFFHTADIQWEPEAVKGLSLYAAYVGLARDFRTPAAGIDGTPYDWGFVVQAGYLLNDQWEVFGRYDFTNLDADAPNPAGSLGAAARIQNHVNEITAGVNYYLKGHNAKFTFDLTYLPGGAPLDANGAGILANTSDDDQFLIRGQFQLLL